MGIAFGSTHPTMLVSLVTPLPTPWPKAEFEAYERDVQARRKQLRADKRREAEMSALFREQQE